MGKLSERLKCVLDDCINCISPIQQDVIDKSVDRLAAIEDILGDEYDLDRLRELAQADREGWCVVLKNSRKQREVAFNVVVRYGFCGDCRHILDSDRCQECDCFWNGVRIIRKALLGDDAENALRRGQN